jgi:hypothetical protein
MNRRPSYLEIQPLLVSRQVDKGQDRLHCVFACPVTHRQVLAEASISQGSGFKDRLIDAAAHSFWYEVRQAVARKICSFLPYGFVREVVEGTAWRMAYGHNDQIRTSDELNESTVEAFLSVRDQFEHDGVRWTGREVVAEFVTDFERQLKQSPITTRYEGEILARTLLSLAQIDGLEQAERDFLASFAPDGGDATPPSVVELGELSEEVKPTVYMLACALGLVDQQRSAREGESLERLEQALGLDADQAANLRRAAGQFIVEQCLGLNSQPSPSEIQDLADLAGIASDEVERVLVRRRKRS